MKYIFLIASICLVLASIFTWGIRPEQQAGVRVVYWVSDPNPTRQMQMDAFNKWAETNVPEEDRFELRLDSANRDATKMIIQSVSGVAGEILDLRTPIGDVSYFNKIGVPVDLTDIAKERGFSLDKTYENVHSVLSVDDRQLVFPCNLFANMYWVNVGTLEKYGLEVPSRDWTWDDFETLAKDFSQRANQGLKHRQRFLIDRIELLILLRNRGLDILNETLTASTINDPVFIEELKRIHRWTYQDRILPSKADIESISTESAYGGSTPQMFRIGNYGMFLSGRWALCQLRLFDDYANIQLAAVPPPDGGFQNTSSGARASAINKGSRYPRLAEYFLEFLASPEYSMTVVESADAIPPLPEVTTTEAYLRPKDFPNEWGCHEVFSWGISNIGYPLASSPYISEKVYMREVKDAEEAVMTSPSLRTPEEAAERAERRINQRIEDNLAENPRLGPRFEEAQQRQAEIDRRKAAGEKIPRELISNTFYVKYYEAKGMLE